MEIKCNLNTYYNNNYHSLSYYDKAKSKGIVRGNRVEDCVQIINKRSVADKNATGRLSFKGKFNQALQNYKKNLAHTYNHKVVFAIVEKQLFKKNSIDSITHDLDKLVLYALGFPKSFVSKFHRKHSEHHTESNKKMNLRSMVCDNIASSPFFKPEKPLSVREHYNNSPELHKIEGLKELLEKYNYGEELNYKDIKEKQCSTYEGLGGVFRSFAKMFTFMF